MGALFDDFLVVGLSNDARGSLVPELRYSFGQRDSAARAAVMEFCFPDVEDSSLVTMHSESFTFTLTQDDGSRLFGFSRRLSQPAPQLPICLCVLTRKAWFSFFMHMLDILQLNYDLKRFVPAFVAAAHCAPLPPPGETLVVSPRLTSAEGGRLSTTFRLSCPEEDRTSGVSFEPLLAAVGVPGVLRLLAALLTEQKVIFVGTRWGHVSSCAHAMLALLYPFQWQHIFIPVLPTSKLSYACAPMPFVLGVLARHLRALQQEPLDSLLYVDLDKGKISAEASVLAAAQLPRPHRDTLQAALSRQIRLAKANSTRLDNAAVAEAALSFMVDLIGPYKRHVVTPGSGKAGELHPAFDEKGFIEAAPPTVQPFLTAMRGAQLFEVFIHQHVGMPPQAQQQSAFERALKRASASATASSTAAIRDCAAQYADALPSREQMRDRATDRLRAGVAALVGIRRASFNNGGGSREAERWLQPAEDEGAAVCGPSPSRGELPARCSRFDSDASIDSRGSHAEPRPSAGEGRLPSASAGGDHFSASEGGIPSPSGGDLLSASEGDLLGLDEGRHTSPPPRREEEASLMLFTPDLPAPRSGLVDLGALSSGLPNELGLLVELQPSCSTATTELPRLFDDLTPYTASSAARSDLTDPSPAAGGWGETGGAAGGWGEAGGAAGGWGETGGAAGGWGETGGAAGGWGETGGAAGGWGEAGGAAGGWGDAGSARDSWGSGFAVLAAAPSFLSHSPLASPPPVQSSCSAPQPPSAPPLVQSSWSVPLPPLGTAPRLANASGNAASPHQSQTSPSQPAPQAKPKDPFEALVSFK
ncbi:hypothetical protein AB1Y20_005814 [Prymnesium parvum]|uniref:UDENN domain-containing protein n=1 Tax=Prymnesium parvum TaxID=97485 RepID=A0AB34J2P7_PRYPA